MIEILVSQLTNNAGCYVLIFWLLISFTIINYYSEEIIVLYFVISNI